MPYLRYALFFSSSVAVVSAATSRPPEAGEPRTPLQLVGRMAATAAAGLLTILITRAIVIRPVSSYAAAVSSPKDDAGLHDCLGKERAFAARLSHAIKCKTISSSEPGEPVVDHDEMMKLHAHLQSSFPLTHKHLKRRVVNKYSLLYEWVGTEAKAQQPYLVYAHLDVVPAPNVENWRADPFGGEIKEDCVWGRGAIDNKQAVLGHFEAVELLLASGFKPKRTVYFAFGHDEEVGGEEGAKQISELLQAEGVALEFMLDEGASTPGWNPLP